MAESVSIRTTNVLSLFSQIKKSHYRFLVPVYQRQYAWRENEIHQLMDDLFSVGRSGEDENISAASLGESRVTSYYIGSLICLEEDEKEKKFKVCDGQQRLITLILLFKAISLSLERAGLEKDPIDLFDLLEFDGVKDCYNKILKQILDSSNAQEDNSESERDDEETLKHPLVSGFNIIQNYLRRGGQEDNAEEIEYAQAVLAGAKKTLLKLNLLPPKTDENHLFITINKMAFQLEQADYIKAKLMEIMCNTENGRRRFNELWEAVKNMDEYLVSGVDARKRASLFGQDYLSIPSDRAIETFLEDEEEKTEVSSECEGLFQVLNSAPRPEHANAGNGDENNSELDRRESILTFPYFLSYCLRVFFRFKASADIRPDRNRIPIDDKLILKAFTNLADREEIKEFFFFLIRFRFFYDVLVVRSNNRASQTDKNEKRWVILCAINNDKSDKNKISYDRSCLEKDTHDYLVQLQSCLRVNFTSPKSMIWLEEFMCKAYEMFRVEQKWDRESAKFKDLLLFLRNWTRKKVSEELNKADSGTKTPHILFNYLDFLIWEVVRTQSKDIVIQTLGCAIEDADSFEFAFRNSVEHFYPQHPSKDGTDGAQENYIDSWEGKIPFQPTKEIRKIDIFGNLCLMTSSQNTRFLNKLPLFKIYEKPAIVATGSLKLRIMAEICEKSKITGEEIGWFFENAEEHGRRMRELLREDVLNN